MPIRYLFFDFDGVILDSEPLYQKYWIEACKENGFVLSIEQELPLRSRDHQLTEEYFKSIFGEKADYHKIHETRKRLMGEYLKNHDIPLKDGVKEVFQFIKKETDLKIAIVTSSPIDYVKSHAGNNNILLYIDKIISVHGLPRGKPFPYVYLKALEETGLKKEEVLVFEDSPNGVASAFNAGLKVIFVKDLSPADEEIKQKSIKQLDKISNAIEIIKKYTK